MNKMQLRRDENGRPLWDDIWMSMALLIANRSVDPRRKVGAVIVTFDNTQVLALGYNGNYKGGKNKVQSIKPGESGFIHAEINALLKLDYNIQKEKIMYVTTLPCEHCAKCIVNSGINRVIYLDDYRDHTGLDVLRTAAVDVSQLVS
jgi:dCMP deaminase